MTETAQSRVAGFFRNEQIILAILAVVTGLAAGLGGVAFRHAISGVQYLVYGSGTDRLNTFVESLAWWHVLLAPVAGGLVVALMARFLTSDQRFHGVPDVIEASAMHGGRMKLRDGCVAALGSFTSLGFGASAGREGPVVHIGAVLASTVAQWFKLRRSLTMTLLGCGVAAGIAASFNAPIAGVFFALEVVIGHYGLTAFAPVVLASVMGTIVTRIVFGDFPAFALESQIIVSLWETPAFALLGIVAAGVAYLFMFGIFFVQDTLTSLKIPMMLRPIGGGLLVGAIAVFFPQVLGVGYDATDIALQGGMSISLLIALVVFKTVATSITLGSGFGGGVFSPSIFVGAMLGGAFGLIASFALPDHASSHSVYAIVGMGAVAGAVLGAPISTILIVFELTANFDLTIAVMIATALASLITNHVIGKSFFRWHLERRNVDITGGQVRALMRDMRVRQILSQKTPILAPDADKTTILAALADSPTGNFVVVDANQKLQGVVTLEDLRPLLIGDSGENGNTAGELAREPGTLLTPEDDLAEALDRMEKCDDDFIPVVDDTTAMQHQGIVRKRDLVREHNRALVDASTESRGGTI